MSVLFYQEHSWLSYNGLGYSYLRVVGKEVQLFCLHFESFFFGLHIKFLSKPLSSTITGLIYPRYLTFMLEG